MKKVMPIITIKIQLQGCVVQGLNRSDFTISDVTACCVLWFVKCEVHCCDFLQFLVHFYSQVLLIQGFNINFSSQYVLLGHTLCCRSNIIV